MDDERLFNELRVKFGPLGRANELSLDGFRLLSDRDANVLVDRIDDFPVKAELLRMRAPAAAPPAAAPAKVFYLDKRVQQFDSSKGSDLGRANKQAKNASATHPYWSTCVICGASATQSRPITGAHIIRGVKGHSYVGFGTEDGFIDDLDVQSDRNFIPLCGTFGTGDPDCCHDLFDSFKVTILWNPILQVYYLYFPCYDREGKTQHGAVLNIPSEFRPYRRLLAFRAYKCGLKCVDFGMFNLPQLTIAQDTGSLACASSFEADSHDQSVAADVSLSAGSGSGSASSMSRSLKREEGSAASSMSRSLKREEGSASSMSISLVGVKRGVNSFEEDKQKRAIRWPPTTEAEQSTTDPKERARHTKSEQSTDPKESTVCSWEHSLTFAPK